MDSVLDASEAKDWNAARRLAEPLLKVHGIQDYAALALIHLIRQEALAREDSIELALILFETHHESALLLGRLGHALDSVYDRRYLNADPPSEPVFEAVANKLFDAVDAVKEVSILTPALSGLSCVARVLGRGWDEVAESAALRLIDLEPSCWERRYDPGLYYKTRGRFAAGQRANELAQDLGGGEDQAVVWNLGICATGAGDAEAARAAWAELGQH